MCVFLSCFISFSFYVYIDEYKHSINMLEKNRDVILKKARDKYNKPEEKIKIMYEKNKYRNITDEQKNKRRDCERNRYCNMTEEKEKRREYARIRYHTMIKVC